MNAHTESSGDNPEITLVFSSFNTDKLEAERLIASLPETLRNRLKIKSVFIDPLYDEEAAELDGSITPEREDEIKSGVESRTKEMLREYLSAQKTAIIIPRMVVDWIIKDGLEASNIHCEQDLDTVKIANIVESML